MSKAQWYQDDAGNISSTRIISVIVVMVFMVVWATVSLKNMSLQPLDFGDAAFIGVIIAGKVTQKRFENGRKQ